MKRAEEPWGQGFLYVRVLRRDIKNTLGLFRNIFPKVVIRTNKFEFQDDLDLDSVSDPLPELEIMGHDFPRWASLKLSRTQSLVLISDRNDIQLGALADSLKELLDKRRRLRFLTMPWMLLPLSLLTLANLAIGVSDLLPEPGSSVTISAIILAGCAYSWWTLRRRVAIAHLTDSRVGFLKRNRDQVLLALVSATLGAAISALAILLAR